MQKQQLINTLKTSLANRYPEKTGIPVSKKLFLSKPPPPPPPPPPPQQQQISPQPTLKQRSSPPSRQPQKKQAKTPALQKKPQRLKLTETKITTLSPDKKWAGRLEEQKEWKETVISQRVVIFYSSGETEHTPFFEKIRDAIESAFLPCELLPLEEEAYLHEINGKALACILGTKGTLRSYPNIKEHYKPGFLGQTPLLFMPDPEKLKLPAVKKAFWEDIKKILSKFS